MDDYKYLFKIVLVGNAGVGKTCLVRQFTQGNLPGGHQGATIGVDFMIKTVKVSSGIKIKLQLWDTAGQERFRSITQSYYRSAHCLILVYDISSQPSYDALAKWIRDVDAVLDRETQLGSEVLRVLVGNKCDKEREIPYSIGEKFASINKFDLFMETSALNNESVEKLFYDIAEILSIRRSEDEQLQHAKAVRSNQMNNNNKLHSTSAGTITSQNLSIARHFSPSSSSNSTGNNAAYNSTNSNNNNNSAYNNNRLGIVDSLNALDLPGRARSCFQC